MNNALLNDFLIDEEVITLGTNRYVNTYRNTKDGKRRIKRRKYYNNILQWIIHYEWKDDKELYLDQEYYKNDNGKEWLSQKDNYKDGIKINTVYYDSDGKLIKTDYYKIDNKNEPEYELIAQSFQEYGTLMYTTQIFKKGDDYTIGKKYYFPKPNEDSMYFITTDRKTGNYYATYEITYYFKNLPNKSSYRYIIRHKDGKEEDLGYFCISNLYSLSTINDGSEKENKDDFEKGKLKEKSDRTRYFSKSIFFVGNIFEKDVKDKKNYIEELDICSNDYGNIIAAYICTKSEINSISQNSQYFKLPKIYKENGNEVEGY